MKNYVDKAISDLNKILNTDDIRIFCPTSRFGHAFNLSSDSIEIINSDEGAVFHIMSGNTRVAEFTLCQLRGCCGICLSTAAYVNPTFRNKGVGSRLGLLRKQMAKDAGYTVLLCTDVADNFAQKKVLDKNGWIDLFRFRNRRTSNLVDISVLPLDPSYEAMAIATYSACDTRISCLEGKKESCPTIYRLTWKFANFILAIRQFFSSFIRR